MSSLDYRSCDVCGTKTFYDAELAYHEVESEHDVKYLKVGKKQHSNSEYGLCLDNLGDWAVLCKECSKKYKTQIVKK
jgi:hypothetical protein